MLSMVAIKTTSVKPDVALGLNDTVPQWAYPSGMNEPVRIHSGKSTNRIHFIREWAERRGMRQADIVKSLGVDKGLVSKWFKGALPQADNIIRLADLFALDAASDLFRHPDDDWLAKFFRDRSQEELDRMIATLEAAFPKSSGVDRRSSNGRR